jgi:opacity protein-like surface antigen
MRYNAFQTLIIHYDGNRGGPYEGGWTMTRINHFTAVFIFAVAVMVFPVNTVSAEQGMYFGIFGGYTYSPDASWSSDDSGYDYDLNIQETGIFGVKFGATSPYPENYVSGELEYNYLNPDAGRTVLTTAGDDYSALEGGAKIHNFMFNVIVKNPGGKIHPYIGLGIGVSYFDLTFISTSRVNGINYSERRSADDTVFAWQILAGVDIDLTGNLSLDIGGRYFDAADPDADYDVYYGNDNAQVEYHHDEDNYGPSFDFKTFMVTLGLKFRF